MITMNVFYLLLLLSTLSVSFTIDNYVDNEAKNSTGDKLPRRLQNLVPFDQIADTKNYTCDEIIRWLGTEKHYSNDKKNILFGLLASTGVKSCQTQPYILLRDISFGSSKNLRTFFHNPRDKTGKSERQCSSNDELAIVLLSNFSINNNFSHFLHALLRLFCSLIDARIIVWNSAKEIFEVKRSYSLWVDEYFKLKGDKMQWLSSFGGVVRSLKDLGKEGCVSSQSLVYGSGCVRLLPPEKWFGYPGCRAGEVLRAFGTYMRQIHNASTVSSLHFLDAPHSSPTGLKIAFAVRDATALTGMRQISNLDAVQHLIRRTQHITSTLYNVTFEHLDLPSTVQYMATVHIFVSVHGAGMTNMFFMNSGSAVVEIIPYPLCNCRSPDYFYGTGGYYHGSAIAQGIKHYHYCVPAYDMKWHKKPEDIKPGSKCSWKHLHAVQSVHIDPTRFVSLMRNVERDLIASGTIIITKPVINISPHANG